MKKANPLTTMEVLIPDFNGDISLLDIIINEKPEVISHNLETVERLSPKVRSIATYSRSLEVLGYIASSGLVAKSGIMLGLGEMDDEVIKTMSDLREKNVSVMTLGQYLPPSERHLEMVEYVKPEIFEKYRILGLQMGFRHVESGALVRSSYHAERHVSVK